MFNINTKLITTRHAERFLGKFHESGETFVRGEDEREEAIDEGGGGSGVGLGKFENSLFGISLVSRAIPEDAVGGA